MTVRISIGRLVRLPQSDTEEGLMIEEIDEGSRIPGGKSKPNEAVIVDSNLLDQNVSEMLKYCEMGGELGTTM